MWFKNLRIYRITKPWDITSEALDQMLQEKAFSPCGGQDQLRTGWVPPLGEDGRPFVHVATDFIMVCAKRQERLLPSTVVNEQLQEKLEQIRIDEDRRVGKRERQDIKDEIIFSLLPRAFTRSQLNFAYIDTRENLIVVDSASAKRAEELLNLLRDSIGSLPVIPLNAPQQPDLTMTQWVRHGEMPAGFELGDECELESPRDEGRVIRCKKQELTATEMLNHIETGMLIRKVALQWQEALQFVIDDELTVRRLKFSQELLDKADERQPESAAEAFDLDFAIMTIELRAFVQALLIAFGSETAATDKDTAEVAVA